MHFMLFRILEQNYQIQNQLKIILIKILSFSIRKKKRIRNIPRRYSSLTVFFFTHRCIKYHQTLITQKGKNDMKVKKKT
jgi:hypothetical protein